MSIPPYVSPTSIVDWSVDQPDVGTLLIRVRLVGSRKRWPYWVLARAVKRRYLTVASIVTIGQGPTVYAGWGQTDRLRDGALAIRRMIHESAAGRQVASDYLNALRTNDVPRMLEIADYAVTGGRPRVEKATTPDAERSELLSAAAALRSHDRSVDADEVAHLAQQLDAAAVREQATAGQAARAIREVYQHLERLTPALREVVGSDGRSPNQDAAEVVDAAMTHLRAVARGAQETDLQALRALRSYSRQWEEPGDDLTL
ncbi:hypothetical protein [Calidifontibacter terrae]